MENQVEILVEKLTEQLKDFKADYLKRVLEYSAQEHQSIKKKYSEMLRWTFNEKTMSENEILVSVGEYYKGKKWIDKNWKEIHMDEKTFGHVSIYRAEIHFKKSVEKLAFRMIEKGLNPAITNVVVDYVGANLNCVVSDGEKQVKAQTILAGGPVQKPHFRYLIK